MPTVYAGSQEKSLGAGSTGYHITLWNKIGSDRTSQNIDGLIRSVFPESPTISQLNDSDTQIQTVLFYNTDTYFVLTDWWVVHTISLLCWSTPCLTTLLSYTQS